MWGCSSRRRLSDIITLRKVSLNFWILQLLTLRRKYRLPTRHSRIRSHTCTLTHMHTCTYPCAHTHTHTYTCTNSKRSWAVLAHSANCIPKPIPLFPFKVAWSNIFLLFGAWLTLWMTFSINPANTYSCTYTYNGNKKSHKTMYMRCNSDFSTGPH